MTFKEVPPPLSRFKKGLISSERQVREMLKPKDGPFDEPASPKVQATLIKHEHPIFQAVKNFRNEVLRRVLPKK